MGAFTMLSARIARRLAHALYGLKIPETLDPRYEYIWKPLGAFGVFTSWISALALLSSDTFTQRGILYGLAGLFVARALMRGLHRDLFERAFQVSRRRNLGNILFNVLLAIATAAFGMRTA